MQHGAALQDLTPDIFADVTREQAIGILEIARNSVTGYDEAAA